MSSFTAHKMLFINGAKKLKFSSKGLNFHESHSVKCDFTKGKGSTNKKVFFKVDWGHTWGGGGGLQKLGGGPQFYCDFGKINHRWYFN